MSPTLSKKYIPSLIHSVSSYSLNILESVPSDNKKERIKNSVDRRGGVGWGGGVPLQKVNSVCDFAVRILCHVNISTDQFTCRSIYVPLFIKNSINDHFLLSSNLNRI